MNNTCLITCIVNKLQGTIYGGRFRDNAYYDSLSSISKCTLPIFCFVIPEQLDEIRNALDERKAKNITLIPFDFLNQEFSESVMKIKKANYSEMFNNSSDDVWVYRCPEIMWAKTKFIKYMLDSYEFENIIWIDAGLSNSSIIEHKYFKKLEDNKHYVSSGYFTLKFFKRLIEFSESKIFMMQHTNPNNRRIPDTYNKLPYGMVNCATIGGLFGGGRVALYKFVEEFNPYISKMLDRGELYTEESIYSGIVNDNPELFNYILFDSFYHIDSDRYKQSVTNFSNILSILFHKDSNAKQ